jgi:predicted RND superfamily exporter protein
MKSAKNAKILASFTLILLLVSMIGGAFSLRRLQTQYSVMQFLPAHHPALQMDSAVRKRFHLPDSPVFIGIMSLKASQSGTWLSKDKILRLKQATADIKDVKNVENAITVATIEGAADVQGAISVGPLTDLVPKEQWSERILNDKLLVPNLISADGRTVLIYVVLRTSDVATLVNVEGRLKKLLSKTFPEAQSQVGGVPAVQTDLGILLNKELINFLALTLLACALTLFLIFRSFSTIWIPLILTAYCNLMVFTMMALTGITFTILSATIPILVFIAVVSLSVHILLRVYEDGHKAENLHLSKWQLIVASNRAIWLPNLLGSFTTCVGFLTLLTSDVPLIRSYGIAVAAAVMLAWVLTSVCILPLLYLFPLPTPRPWVHRPARWALWVMQKRKPIVIATVAICAAMTWTGRHLDWTGRLFDDLPKGQEARSSTEKIDQTMGGVVPLEVVIGAPKGHDWVEPARIAKLDRLVEEFRHLNGVGTAQSLPELLRASRLHGGGLPTQRKAIAETYFLYNMSSESPLAHFLTADNRVARIQLKLHDLPGNQVQMLLTQLQKRAHKEFPDSHVQIGGMGAIVHLIHDEISHDLIYGFWQALILIVALLALIFRSLRWALVACFPNLIPPVALLGYLALTHTPIKPGVAIIFSIALGLAFNNTVYVLNRMRELRKTNGRLPVGKTFHLEGNPCLVSTLVVMMGFSVFLFSYFELNRTFGACMLVSIVAGLLGDLVFLPALLRLFPTLLEPRSKAAPEVLPATDKWLTAFKTGSKSDLEESFFRT